MMAALRSKRWKYAAIPILSLILAALLMRQRTADEPLLEPQLNLAPVSAPAAPALTPATARRARPEVQLEQLVRFSPFDIPRALQPAPPPQSAAPVVNASGDESTGGAQAQEESARATALLLPGAVQAVYQGPHGAAALIDSRIFQLGDRLESGGRIVDISADGVLIEAP